MSESNGTTPTPKPDLVALRAEIKQTRSELGETVQALAARADVKARAREQVEHTKQRLLDQAAIAGQRLRSAAGQTAAVSGDLADSTVQVRRSQIPVALVVAGLAAVAGVILIVRGRRR